jgi:hypothetical protein
METLKSENKRIATFLIEEGSSKRSKGMEQRTTSFLGRTQIEASPYCPANEFAPNHTCPTLWQSLDEVVSELGLKTQAILNRLVPMSYYPDPVRGRIRFRVMGTPRRTEVWRPDLEALQSSLAKHSPRKRDDALQSHMTNSRR